MRAALNVMAEKGIYTFRMTDVANAAVVGKGTLYEYFPDKSELIANSLRLFMQDYGDFLISQTEKVENPADRLREIINLSFEYFAARKKMAAVMFDYWSTLVPRRSSRESARDFMTVYSRFSQVISSLLDNGKTAGAFREIDPRVTAGIIMAVIDGILFQIILGTIDIHDKSIPAQLSDIILNGISRRKEE
jgi:AcrR family transcriptional regulator